MRFEAPGFALRGVGHLGDEIFQRFGLFSDFSQSEAALVGRKTVVAPAQQVGRSADEGQRVFEFVRDLHHEIEASALAILQRARHVVESRGELPHFVGRIEMGARLQVAAPNRFGGAEEMADQLIESGQMPPAILVAFDANGPRGTNDLTNYCNRVSDGYRVEDFITSELFPQIDATYRTCQSAAQRALWGYSSGGFGALNLGLHHPDIWKIWASHAGFYRAGDDAPAMTKILGPQAKNPQG